MYALDKDSMVDDILIDESWSVHPAVNLVKLDRRAAKDGDTY